MDVNGYLRVVSLRKGRFKPADFRIREGEKGLSLFAWTDSPDPAVILEAVEAMGKQGNLGVVVLGGQDLRRLGLVLVKTPGGTGSTTVNAVHFEARLTWRRRVMLRLSGITVDEYFNSQLSQ
jgi:hypothetical protein